jgi:hypothetical protein
MESRTGRLKEENLEEANINMCIIWCLTSHSVKLVDVHVEVLDQVLKSRHVATVTNGVDGVHAEEVGMGQGLLKPFALDVHALCNLFISHQKKEENRQKSRGDILGMGRGRGI